MRQQAVILGAGNVGRGFLGQLFSESGYNVTFVDIDQPLIEALRSRGSYTIRLVNNEKTEQVQVGPVSGLLSTDVQAVAQVVASATIGATAVGARVLPYIAPTLAAGITLRARQGVQAPLNIIVCENLKGAAAYLRGLVVEHLDEQARAYLADHVGFVDTVIGRMVPELPAALRAQDPSLIIVEPYKELPVDRSGFVGEIPTIVGMEPCDNFPLYTARKLYLHNAGHAVLAYLGYRRGHTLGYEALEDPDIRPILDAALDESVQGIVARYGASADWLKAHVADLLQRFANRVLADPVLRLGRDPLRKLAPSDRLVGAARTAEAAGIVPVNLAWAIAGALAFDTPEDPIAVSLQERIKAEGLEAVMTDVCQIDAQEPLGKVVLERYRLLREEARWQ
ncbi:MAG: mannitol-1-phosphate 5-dehydrogenase [Chloroflexi bacterium]|jgi:mannitol-1-phosphate 5-dehydrogenase|nr:mannitol-1-phosphate 5-dehydrogenase [Chloroflexota bacterium]